MKGDRSKQGIERRRVEGEERNAYWRSLSPQQQLASLNRRKMHAKRQREKLEAAIAGVVVLAPLDAFLAFVSEFR